ncbi:GNAT family N-acetyltransferase [Staphylococcus carnosus]|uniref:N-acetyltransferase domain-containing protein n=1 Tax=Staphylococcus carnosus (strain TM300) TaxID=396513 RepID=B9DMB5_STACT|nr:GNAT family N-acetyltransferase [Staphylococcus carnosus]KOR12435.1 acetyltransferase [Staphylococcus carnosus]QPT04633.1 GNAT family N-acetyltransferase [Staphylococcus carnosus]UQA67358.1 GNAT family N-acetyltransferase [Staphylococcus carnosus]UTB77808.1 acetyltransferase [Staphylococcus carnosus]UTB87353.1 acetyltransferase [Staphylococcus carnosus]
MKHRKQYDDITIQPYEQKYYHNVLEFELSERQQIYSSLPIQVLEDALEDEDRIANIAINKDKEVIGFFVLHQYYQHEGYDTPENVVYIRSLSVNEKFQGNGYGTKIMMNLPDYVQSLYSDFNHLYLVVDAENQAAWNVYERAGFMHAATKEEGPIGKERLYYLDLDSKYVSSLKLIAPEAQPDKEIDTVNLVLDGEKVGFIALQATNSRMHIRGIEVYEQFRNQGIAESALRQLATYVRKNYPTINALDIILFGEHNELKPLCMNSNFVETLQTNDYVKYEKYIVY